MYDQIWIKYIWQLYMTKSQFQLQICSFDVSILCSCNWILQTLSFCYKGIIACIFLCFFVATRPQQTFVCACIHYNTKGKIHSTLPSKNLKWPTNILFSPYGRQTIDDKAPAHATFLKTKQHAFERTRVLIIIQQFFRRE